MKSCRQALCFKAPNRRAFINITPDVQTCIDKKKRIGTRKGHVWNRVCLYLFFAPSSLNSALNSLATL